MNEHFCEEHQVAYRKFEKNGKTWYAHHDDENDAWCNEVKKDSKPATPSYHAPAPKFDSDGMLKCNAMNNAIATINADNESKWEDLEAVYNTILEIFRK